MKKLVPAFPTEEDKDDFTIIDQNIKFEDIVGRLERICNTYFKGGGKPEIDDIHICSYVTKSGRRYDILVKPYLKSDCQTAILFK